MAKAVFHKGQRVFVRTVGTWAHVEQVLPQWVKGVEEPLKVHYDVGLGREFAAHELQAEARTQNNATLEGESWRLLRLTGRLHYAGAGGGGQQPHPGTFPVVVTDQLDWGGWRVPAAEYDRDPDRIEQQARVIAQALRLKRIAQDYVRLIENDFPKAPAPLLDLAERAQQVLDLIYAPDDPHAVPVLEQGTGRGAAA